jgi:hypothetical protein
MPNHGRRVTVTEYPGSLEKNLHADDTTPIQYAVGFEADKALPIKGGYRYFGVDFTFVVV